MHRQWQSYNGFTFALNDFVPTGMIDSLDSENATIGYAKIDPLTFGSRLARIPKLAVLSSDDEYMQFDWSNIWYDDARKYGEFHLMITPNAEHTLATNMLGAMASVSGMYKSIASGITKRPDFNYTYDESTGEITVKLDGKPKHIRMWHTQTLQSKTRDFRWVREANDHTPACTFPFIPLNPERSHCLQLTLWLHKDLEEWEPGVYKATPPESWFGWTGYYIEVIFEGDTDVTNWMLDNVFRFSTPGYTWPTKLPFPDCNSNEGTCLPRLV